MQKKLVDRVSAVFQRCCFCWTAVSAQRWQSKGAGAVDMY